MAKRKVNRKFVRFVCIIFAWVALIDICLVTYHFFFKEKYKSFYIELVGEPEMTIGYGDTYSDPGFIAYDAKDGDLTANVVTDGNVDTSRLGQYTLVYKITNSRKKEDSVSRVVNVVDNKSPEITLNGEEKIFIFNGKKYEDEGCIASDNYDGDLSSSIVVNNDINYEKAGIYTIKYEIKDSSGNESSAERKIYIDTMDDSSVDNYVVSLEKYIKAKNYKVSVGYYNIENEYTYKYKNETVYYGASLIKTLDALYIYENNMVTSTTRNWVKEAISVSSNSAHANLIKTIGFQNLKKYGNNLGTKYTLIGGDNYGNTTVDDQLVVFKKLYNFLETSDYGDELKGYFINDYSNYLIYEGSPKIAHKYGWFDVYYHNVGIVYDKHPYIIVILSNGNYSSKPEIFRDLSKKIYNLNQLMHY